MQSRLNKMITTMPQSGIRRVAELAREIPGCISLTLGEPAFDTPAPIREATKSALDRGMTHYPPNAGIPALREAIAAYESRHYAAPLAAENVLVTAGSTEALACAFFAVLEPGDEVVVPVPAFGLYAQQIQMARGSFVPLYTAKSGFQLGETDLAACITPRTKAIVINSPNNPTGVQYTQASMDAVTRVCIRHNLFLVYDAVYDRLSFAPPVPQPDSAALGDRLIRCNAFSKPYAMTGWRMGYSIADAHIQREMAKAHAALAVGVSTFSQHGCIDIFDIPIDGMLEAYRKNRDFAYARLCEMGMEVVRPTGAFYVFPSIQAYGLSDEAFVDRLMREAAVAVVPGSCFGTPGYIRISTCGDSAELTTGLDRMASFLQEII